MLYMLKIDICIGRRLGGYRILEGVVVLEVY